jgi:hypothetical protein
MRFRAAQKVAVRVIGFFVILVASHSGPLTEQPTTHERIDGAIAMGRACRAPIVHLPAGSRDFDVYIESPIARIALSAATAVQMHQPYDEVRATRELTSDYRIWADYAPSSVRTVRIVGMTLRSRRGIVRPTGESNAHFTLGYVASHGIVEALRWRSSQFSFAALPDGPFDVTLDTSRGPQRYAVSEAARAGVMDVCNPAIKSR